MRSALTISMLTIIATTLACNAVNFDPGSKITGVRVLATRADKPYAKPGDTVTMDVLAVDGRAVRPRPMSVSWIPLPCVDPPSDAYYACFSAFSRVLKPGVDLTPILTQGTSLTFQMPADAITKHGKSQQTYGVAVVFSFACAGHVEYVTPPAGLGPNATPFACFDENHTQLGPDQFVFAYSLVYAFDERTNANPKIDHLAFGGASVDPAQGITVDHCQPGTRCTATTLDMVLADGAEEPDPSATQPDGTVPGEQVWVDYYYTDGHVKSDTLTLFDPKAGKLPSDNDDYTPPNDPSEQMLWAVVHDNRGGADWLSIPVHVR